MTVAKLRNPFALNGPPGGTRDESTGQSPNPTARSPPSAPSSSISNYARVLGP